MPNPDTLKEADLNSVDWFRNALAIGIKIAGENPPWTEFEQEDLAILAGLLEREIQPGVPAAASISTPLRYLRNWCLAAKQQLRAQQCAIVNRAPTTYPDGL